MMVIFDEETVENNPFSEQCSISDLLDLFSLTTTQDDITFDIHSTSLRLVDEIRRLRNESAQCQCEISQLLSEKESSISSTVGFDVEFNRSLLDAFVLVERSRYPLAWSEMLKIKTVIPTTVSCEQSFSVWKHVQHKNMKRGNVIAKIATKYHRNQEMKQI